VVLLAGAVDRGLCIVIMLEVSFHISFAEETCFIL
jgi:hypothetical protein